MAQELLDKPVYSSAPRTSDQDGFRPGSTQYAPSLEVEEIERIGKRFRAKLKEKSMCEGKIELIELLIKMMQDWATKAADGLTDEPIGSLLEKELPKKLAEFKEQLLRNDKEVEMYLRQLGKLPKPIM